MQLVKLSTYQKAKYPFGDGPSMKTLRKQCMEGLLPGARKEGRLWYIDLDVNTAASSDPLVEQVLNSIGR
ncbi:hypothetical protein H0A36_27395 [Endozoicomonas sp. SM1973]|uniref:Uncharacterized protein n=1 Tax=Spartinivicinus marinus TaxID=2994442 RepID=A0A853II56_9GAMM|nr:hypothetical protein [Spartinivicinus marinus]MCX4025086.1 hypothetical protein [Spartinivicinus marinus]NYZ69741.1 hypothetical protein [Spartinivicinus marinus]